MPSLLKEFLEQVMRPMPAPLYRFWYRGHGVSGFRRNILNFVGIGPVRETCLARSRQLATPSVPVGSS
jgi:hypothetical protein